MSVLAAAMMSANVLVGSLANPGQCLQALTPLPEAGVARTGDFARIACPRGGIARPFRYDLALRVTRLVRPVDAGEIVAMFPDFGVATIRPGDTVELVSESGPVRIERDVEALQAAGPGQFLFVKSGDGQILSVRYEDVVP